MKTLILLISLILFAGCTTHTHSEGREAYEALIEKHSAGDKSFSGLYETFEFRATLLNREVSQAIHNRIKKFYAFDEQTAHEKLQKRMDELSSISRVWVSFFTPSRADDNLSNKKNIWKVYLVNNGQRYEGRVYKAPTNQTEAQALFNYHNRWTTPYLVDFPLPTDELATNPKLIITGPLGRREVTF